MEIRFSASVITAIDGLMRLHRGEFKGSPKPDWTNFRFPTKVKAGSIENGEWHDPHLSGPSKERDIVRKFEFFYQGKKIASVFLFGVEIHWDAIPSHNQTFWGVRSIEYLPDLMEGTVEDETVEVRDSKRLASR